jgi:hypothetical protein
LGENICKGGRRKGEMGKKEKKGERKREISSKKMEINANLEE